MELQSLKVETLRLKAIVSKALWQDLRANTKDYRKSLWASTKAKA